MRQPKVVNRKKTCITDAAVCCCIKCDTEVTWHLTGDRLSLAGSVMDSPLRFLLLLTGLGLNGKNTKSDHMFQISKSLELLILISFWLDSAWKRNHQRSQGPWQWNAVYGLSAKYQWSSYLRRVPHQCRHCGHGCTLWWWVRYLTFSFFLKMHYTQPLLLI